MKKSMRRWMMLNFNIYIFTKAGNKSRYTMIHDDMRSLTRDYNLGGKDIKNLSVKCVVTGVLAIIPIENIDFIQCQKISDNK